MDEFEKLGEEEMKIKTEAENFVKENKIRIANEIVAKFTPVSKPISYFMAGSPGAGKTEFSVGLLLSMDKKISENFLRMDADEFRSYFPGYTGGNSHLFQGVVSTILENVHNLTLNKNLNFLMDGTFSNYEKAKLNIERSVKRGREVIIFYVYQKPEVAWQFTQDREKVEGRRITKSAFIKGFLKSHENVRAVKKEFKDRIKVVLVYKDYMNNSIEDVIKDVDADSFETYFDKWYTKEDLESLIK